MCYKVIGKTNNFFVFVGNDVSLIVYGFYFLGSVFTRCVGGFVLRRI